MIELKRILNIYKKEQVDDFLKEITGFNLNEKDISVQDIKENWNFVGDNESNASSIEILKNGEKGLIERITNGIDAVIEKWKDQYNVKSPKTPDDVVKIAFPEYFDLKKSINNGETDRLNAFGKVNVLVAINDGSKNTKPTLDVIDFGTGIKGDGFKKTILSIQAGNKLSSEKGYVIGAFGQGGSTSLAFAYATIIVSKKEDKFYFTIVKPVTLKDYKNHCYVYLKINQQIPECKMSSLLKDEYLNNFICCESGTFVRMIEMDISKEYRMNDITKPRMLYDYINSELFNVSIPIKVIENRANYVMNLKTQDRYSYGSYLKLHTYKKYVNLNYSGSIKIDYKNNAYNIEYFVILPSNEEDWGRDAKAKEVFGMFNTNLNPIIYTANGQMINSEPFTRLKNVGLSMLKYRLLVIINLDVLGIEKYRFFTTDRNQIKSTDDTKDFLDKVIYELAREENLLSINNLIADKAIDGSVDNELLSEISNDVKGLYNKYLKGGSILHGRKGVRTVNPSEEEFFDHITKLEITTTQKTYYRNETVRIIVETGATKSVNENSLIYIYLDGKAYYGFVKTTMNGHIQFNIDSLIPGDHKIKCSYFNNDTNSIDFETSDFEFEILNEDLVTTPKTSSKVLNIDIKTVKEKEAICEIIKNDEDKSITVEVCLDSDEMYSSVYGLTASSDTIKSFQKIIIKPIALFCLFLGESYDAFETEYKNKIIINMLKANFDFYENED